MHILPLKFVREEDKKTIGLNLFNLAKLNHLGLPVIDSVIAIAPPHLFENAVNRYLKNHPNLKESLPHIKSEIMRLPVPEGLKNLEIANSLNKTSTIFNIQKLWENLLEKWSFELISKIERGEKNHFHLTPQLVVFSANFTTFGRGYYDEDREHAVIKVEQGKIDFHTSSAIENLIIVGNKKLYIPQIYYWGIEDNKIKIVKVLPYTQSLPEEPKEEKGVAVSKNEKIIKTATKIFLDFNDEVITGFNFDGVVLNIKKLNLDLINNQISKIQTFDSNAKFIFYPDKVLGENRNLEFAQTFLFFKNKKQLNCQIVLPETFSVDEYLNLKREFASLGIYSKGALKIWKQFNNPADFLNLDEYLDAGFDGAVVDVNQLGKTITGVDPDKILSDVRIDWISSIEKFFKELSLSKIIKSGKQILIKGNLVKNEELLNYFIKSGVWGIALENRETSGIKEHISFTEKQILKKMHSVKIDH